MNVTRAMSARQLQKLRVQALKAGNLPVASAVRDAQKLRRDGFHAAAQAKLASVGLAVDSSKMRSTFPVESRLVNRGYRVCQNLKRETTKVSRDRLMVTQRSQFDRPKH
jgi:hypothetical protein